MLHLESPSHPAGAATEFALWNLGSRPFYLLASVFAALSVLLWTFEYAGPPWFVARYFDVAVDGPAGARRYTRLTSVGHSVVTQTRSRIAPRAQVSDLMVGRVGIEPTTKRLRAKIVPHSTPRYTK
jgi:hypothetical protein